MAIIKCKMCGGELDFTEGAGTAKCEYCDTVQTIPNLDDEKKLIQFERAERLRKQCEFDKAAGIYETIVADFREESEAYWGLVLCKYGIEYVDDPGTGKKVPTCHRSSFDSIMDDPDLEQALENAGPDARRLYREEAKAIEEIRKGIISVSSTEKPYDIFICYKETDPRGDRTLDSVLAQEIYDKLTDKGYRVFFSRITLEDKLGLEYEPYIFAALNSAKVMLAFGTDYEYFNAVWVKNEWSRFLKLMAKDKEKHLIPCFKGIDAYDMPKEFARLQSQDLGKVGADQDLLRGIEKLLPKKEETKVIVQEKVVVGGSGNNKIASLLDRGNMALEDGDWAKADSFFEDVLNNDSKNAQAYLGKTLAQEKCRTIDAFIRKRKEARNVKDFHVRKVAVNQAHIQAAAEKYCVPGYLSDAQIREMYDFDLTYDSQVPTRTRLYQEEETYWASHKSLSRAEQFATGAVAENLAREKSELFKALQKNLDAAKLEAKKEEEAVRQRYEAHLAATDARVLKMYEDACKKRDDNYETWSRYLEDGNSKNELIVAQAGFEQLEGYLDSRKKAELCKAKLTELKQQEAEQARQEEAARLAEEKRLQEEKAAAALARKKRNKKIAIITLSSLTAIAVAIALLVLVIIPGNRYSSAMTLMVSGKYEEAMVLLDKIPTSYKDTEAQYTQAFTAIKDAYRAQADKYLAGGDLINAAIYYGKAGEHTLAEQTYDINSRFAVDEYIIAGIMKDGTLKYQTNNKYDNDPAEALEDLNGVASLIAHTTEGVNGLTADGKLLTHSTGAFDTIIIYDDMPVDSYSGIRQVAHGIADDYYVVLLLEDGTLECVAENGTQLFSGIENWKNIRQIEDHHSYILGIDADGKVHISYVRNETGNHTENLAKWPAVEKIYSSGSAFLAALTKDHKLVLSNDGSTPSMQRPNFLTTLSDVQDIYFMGDNAVAERSLVAVLYTSGKVTLYDYDGNVVENEEINGWREVVKLQTGLDNKMIGITHKGTVMAYGDNIAAYEGWTDIVAIQNYYGYSEYYFFSVGVKSDGTMVTTSDGTYVVPREVTGATGKSSYWYDKESGGTYCNISTWDLW